MAHVRKIQKDVENGKSKFAYFATKGYLILYTFGWFSEFIGYKFIWGPQQEGNFSEDELIS